MNITPQIFSVIYFIACGIYLFFGVYALVKQPKESLNRTFFGVCLTLFVWSLAFSFAVTASDQETCLFWRRFSALGWSSIYAALLHFLLILTENQEITKRRPFLWLLYFPAVICIVVFALPTAVSAGQYNLIYTPYGWTNLSSDNILDHFFNVYFISYVLAGLWLLWRWGRKSSEIVIKKQAAIILVSFIAAFVLGSTTDVVFSMYFQGKLPQMAPIFILIPIALLYYSTRYFGLMNIHLKREELILTQVTRLRVYYFLAVCCIIGAVLSFSATLFTTDHVFDHFLSAVLLVIGITIQIIGLSRLKDNTKDTLLLCAIAIILLIFLTHSAEYASITVWAAPLAVLMLFVVFDQRKMLAVLSLLLILLQVAIWILSPNKFVHVDSADYFVRLGIVATSCFMAFQVNRIYRVRLKENSDQIQMQRLISELSTDFISADSINIQGKIDNMFINTGKVLPVREMTFALLDIGAKRVYGMNHWHSKASGEQHPTESDIDFEQIATWLSRKQENGFFCISSVDNNQPSLVGIALPTYDNNLGLLWCQPDLGRKWQANYAELLKILANIVVESSAKVKAEEKLNQLAYYDQITEVGNRFFFKYKTEEAIKAAQNSGNSAGVMILDLDGFKTINDTLGHEGGDKLLQIVAQRLKAFVRMSDTVARFGGDEFLVLIQPVSNINDLSKIVEHLMGVFNKAFIINGQEFFISASAGVARYPQDGKDVDTLVKHADLALYRAKETGKRKFMLCTSEMREEAQKTFEIVNNLYQAEIRNELFLCYQPQIDLKSGRIVGLEALLRWKHPKQGLVMPGIFIPAAEKYGLINNIGAWVLYTACEQNKFWQEIGLPPVRIAVNVSFNQLIHPDFVSQVEGIIQKTRINPEYLDIEITETAAMKDPSYIAGVLEGLKALGVTISLDDFGTEYSSLNRLKLLPFDCIKMDMQFVRGINGSPKDQSFARMIINLAKNLDLRLIAEGVETPNQDEFLYLHQCDEAQGYYYSKPLPASEIKELLRQKQNMREGV